MTPRRSGRESSEARFSWFSSGGTANRLRWPDRLLYKGAHEPRALGRGDAAALHERLPGPEVDGVADGRLQQRAPGAPGAPSGGQQVSHVVEVALEGRQSGRKRRNEINVTKDVGPHARCGRVVLVELVERRLEPHCRLRLATPRLHVRQRV